MKKMIYLFCIATSGVTLFAGTDSKSIISTNFIFNDLPKVKQLTPDQRNALLLAVVPKTIIIIGEGGYDTSRDIVCPDPGSSKCGTIVTDFVNGNYGPSAQITVEGTQQTLIGIIEEPIVNQDGEVVNFRFSSIIPN